MKKKKEVISANYLEKIPYPVLDIPWHTDKKGLVTLDIENTGLFNKIAQKFFHKPKISQIHLDATGSFLWPRMDGEKDIIALGKELKEEFGEEAEPLYERLAKFFQILDSYHFIQWK